MRILMVAGKMHVGGLENQLMHFARNVDKNSYCVDFTSNKPDAFFREEIESLGGKFILFNHESRRSPIKYCIEMYRIMKDGQYDVVHCHELFHSGMTLFVAKLAGIPCRFVHAHSWCEGDETGGNYKLTRRMYHHFMRFLIRCFSTVQIACSTWAGRFLYGEKVMKKKSYHLIYNSVDTDIFLKCFGQEESGEFLEKDGFVNVINVARICTMKNHIFLVEIAKELKRRGDKIRILCVGSGDEIVQKDVEDRIHEYGVEDYITIVGVRKDIDVLLRKSKAFVFPTKYEGMPLVMIEAQASGLPCISADTYSREVDFEIGMVKWMDLSEGVEKWTDAVEEAVGISRAPKGMVVNAIEKKGFDSKIFTRKLCELYQEDYNKRGKNK